MSHYNSFDAKWKIQFGVYNSFQEDIQERMDFAQSLVEIVIRDQIVCGLPNIVECTCGQGIEKENSFWSLPQGNFFTMNL